MVESVACGVHHVRVLCGHLVRGERDLVHWHARLKQGLGEMPSALGNSSKGIGSLLLPAAAVAAAAAAAAAAVIPRGESCLQRSIFNN